jgi:hypothetical protein
MTRQMLRHSLLARVSFIGLLVPTILVLLAAGTSVRADTQLPPIPVVAPSPAQASADGGSAVTAGAPGQDGAALSGRPCTSPCTSSFDVARGSEPTGLRSGHTAAGAGDDSPATSAGAPAASGDSRLTESGSAFGGPSGGWYRAGGCLSTVSVIPAPLPLSGFGFSCPAGTGANEGQPGATAGTNGGTAAGSPGGANPAGAGSVAGVEAGAAGAGNPAPGQAPSVQCPAPAAARSLGLPGLPIDGGPLAALAIALVAMFAGYLTSAIRRRPATS